MLIDVLYLIGLRFYVPNYPDFLSGDQAFISGIWNYISRLLGSALCSKRITGVVGGRQSLLIAIRIVLIHDLNTQTILLKE
jgi:hypothetical protein